MNESFSSFAGEQDQGPPVDVRSDRLDLGSVDQCGAQRAISS
jgi:hypothetical protein